MMLKQNVSEVKIEQARFGSAVWVTSINLEIVVNIIRNKMLHKNTKVNEPINVRIFWDRVAACSNPSLNKNISRLIDALNRIDFI